MATPRTRRRKRPRPRHGTRWGKDRFRARKIRNNFAESVLRIVLLVVVVALVFVFWEFIQPWLRVMWETIRNPLETK